MQNNNVNGRNLRRGTFHPYTHMISGILKYLKWIVFMHDSIIQQIINEQLIPSSFLNSISKKTHVI